MDAESNGTTVPQPGATESAQGAVEGKGKGKAVAQAAVPDVAMDDSEDEEDEDEEEPVSSESR